MSKADRPMTSDERECFNRLAEWVARFDVIMGLYDGRRAFIPAARVAEARELYTRLKRELDAERKRLNNSRVPLSRTEERWYLQPVLQAGAHLSARANTNPEAWHSDLYNAREDIASDLFDMREYLRERESAMTRVAERHHDNGWIAVVDEVPDGDVLVGSALTATGERFEPLAKISVGDDSDYDARMKDAQRAADRAVLEHSGHEKCGCGPWRVTP